MTTHEIDESIFCWTKGKATCLVTLCACVCVKCLHAPVCAHYINWSLPVLYFINIAYQPASPLPQIFKLCTDFSQFVNWHIPCLFLAVPCNKWDGGTFVQEINDINDKAFLFIYFLWYYRAFLPCRIKVFSVRHVWNSETMLKKRHEGGQLLNQSMPIGNTTKNKKQHLHNN